jgi:hypothetical protein
VSSAAITLLNLGASVSKSRRACALTSLVVRGAVPVWARFPIPLSNRACGFPAHGLPMIFLAWLRRLRITDGSNPLPRLHQDVTPVDPVIQGVETPLRRLLGRSP